MRPAGLSTPLKLGSVKGQGKRGRGGFKEKEREEKGTRFHEEIALRKTVVFGEGADGL